MAQPVTHPLYELRASPELQAACAQITAYINEIVEQEIENALAQLDTQTVDLMKQGYELRELGIVQYPDGSREIVLTKTLVEM